MYPSIYNLNSAVLFVRPKGIQPYAHVCNSYFCLKGRWQSLFIFVFFLRRSITYFLFSRTLMFLFCVTRRALSAITTHTPQKFCNQDYTWHFGVKCLFGHILALDYLTFFCQFNRPLSRFYLSTLHIYCTSHYADNTLITYFFLSDKNAFEKKVQAWTPDKKNTTHIYIYIHLNGMNVVKYIEIKIA